MSYRGGHNRVHGSHYAHMHKPAPPAPAMGHRHAPMHDKGARVMNDRGRHPANNHMAMNDRSGKHGHFSHR